MNINEEKTEVLFGWRNIPVTDPWQVVSSSGRAEKLSISNKALDEWMFCACKWCLTARTKSFLNHSARILELF